MNNTEAIIKSSYDAKLTNQDLAPLKKQTWGAYNIFAFWMSDVHSVGGYVMAGSLFALGLNSWQVLLSLLIGIAIVQFFTNLIAKSSQQTGTPYPVILPRNLRCAWCKYSCRYPWSYCCRMVWHSNLFGLKCILIGHFKVLSRLVSLC